MHKLYKTILILSIIGLILPCFSFAQPTTTENEFQKAPNTLEEAKSFIINLITAWINWWKSYIEPCVSRTKNWIKNFWQNTTPIVEQEFEKEKQEIKQDLEKQGEKVKQGVWDRFKQLIKDSL